MAEKLKLRLKPEFMKEGKVRDLVGMFRLPYVSSQGYEVAPKTRPKLRLLGAAACAKEQKIKALFDMFGLRR